MLKRYASDHRLQWVGKAWEIRYALRQAKRQKGGDAKLIDLLPPAMATKQK
jgi:hypothetical protein